jgi:hypothetical protein
MESVAIDQSSVMDELKTKAQNMIGWLKFLGVVTIISGAFAVMTIVGIVFAWIPIWLGVLLIQAGARASNAHITNNPKELVMMLEKLRLYFVIQGVMLIIILTMAIIGIISFGAFIPLILDKIYMS